MKNYLIFSCLIFLLVSCSTIKNQIISVPPEIITIDNLSGEKDDLYIKASVWMAETFVSSKSVIQFKDKEEGIIVGKYLLAEAYKKSDLGGSEKSNVYAIIIVQVRNQKARITISPRDYISQGEFEVGKKQNLTKEETKEKTINTLESFVNYMKNDNSLRWDK